MAQWAMARPQQGGNGEPALAMRGGGSKQRVVRRMSILPFALLANVAPRTSSGTAAARLLPAVSSSSSADDGPQPISRRQPGGRSRGRR